MPRVERLTIPSAKIRDYLLDPDHPSGWSKAKFFLGRGFDRGRPEALADALASKALKGWPGDAMPVPGAVKRRITGAIVCPDGSTPDVLTVWQVDDGSTRANFVTARPARRKPV